MPDDLQVGLIKLLGLQGLLQIANKIDFNGLSGLITIKWNDKTGVLLDGTRIEVWSPAGAPFFTISDAGMFINRSISIINRELFFKHAGKNALQISAGPNTLIEATDEFLIRLKDSATSVAPVQMLKITRAETAFNKTLSGYESSKNKKTIELLAESGQLKLNGINGSFLHLSTGSTGPNGVDIPGITMSTSKEGGNLAFLNPTPLPSGGYNSDIYLSGPNKSIRVGNIDLLGKEGVIDIKNGAQKSQIFLNSNGSDLWIGGNGDGGDLILFPPKVTATRDPHQASIWLEGAAGSIKLKDPINGKERVFLDPQGSDLWIGGNGDGGDLILFPPKVTRTREPNLASIWLEGAAGSIKLRDPINGKERVFLDPQGSDLWMGGNGQGGDVVLFPPSITNTRDPSKSTIWLEGAAGALSLRDTESGNSTEMIRVDAKLNYIVLRNKANKDTVWIHADSSNGYSGIHLKDQNGIDTLNLDGEDGAINLASKAGSAVISPPSIALANKNGQYTVGLNAEDCAISLTNQEGYSTVTIDGKAGDIILHNADCAEEFDIAETAGQVEPGTVMVLDEHGRLQPSGAAFDKRVAGVVSGAGDYKPGIVLDRQKSDKLRLPLALVGKVFCKVDASHGAIQVGDLLTTSPTPGHAMRTDDPTKAFGAVLGKALRPFVSGQGLIPILVALQ